MGRKRNLFPIIMALFFGALFAYQTPHVLKTIYELSYSFQESATPATSPKLEPQVSDEGSDPKSRTGSSKSEPTATETNTASGNQGTEGSEGALTAKPDETPKSGEPKDPVKDPPEKRQTKITNDTKTTDPELRNYDFATAPNILAGGLLGIMFGLGLARVLLAFKARMDDWWGEMEGGHRVNLFLGIFAGLIASMPFLFLLNSLNLGVYIPLAVVGLTLGFTCLAVYALGQMADFLPWTRGKVKAKKTGIKILDTNVLIDGRIYDIAKTGFVEGQIYVPGFVLEELQYIADSHDALRRQRGRRGLEILKRLQADFPTEIRTHDKFAEDQGDGVDSRLVRLARAIGGDIVTNDWNLNRVASVQEVQVLNINDLALSLKPNILPGETLTINVAREGSQFGQGVGYLDDGTMVVVENGRNHIGETVDTSVTQVIQTERGKMIFAEIDSEEENPDGPRRRTPGRRHF
ncbi:MAG: TRAM domain-containing protein [Fimbriimonadaceae bacterium]|nr:TRAM domain-containing protein [Fimbriimonadaceae bacterium]